MGFACPIWNFKLLNFENCERPKVACALVWEFVLPKWLYNLADITQGLWVCMWFYSLPLSHMSHIELRYTSNRMGSLRMEALCLSLNLSYSLLPWKHLARVQVSTINSIIIKESLPNSLGIYHRSVTIGTRSQVTLYRAIVVSLRN